MPRLNDTWTVQPHGALETVDEGLVSVSGEIVMPLGRFPRRMTAVQLREGRVAVWSPIPLREPQMQQLEALGHIAFLIVPGVGHRLDIRAWKARYREAKVVCMPGAAKLVSEAVPVDATGDILDDPQARLETVPGVAGMEAALLVRRAGGNTLLLNDILANVRHPRGLGAHIMARLMGFGVDRPRMPWVGRRMFVKDAAALAAGLRWWANDPALKRVIVSHGDIITDAPRQALERVAAELAA